MSATKNTPNITSRAPVICIMGHIDHGKSTLLDYIRKTNVVDKEAGGITQHISAYEVEHTLADGRQTKITFLDTPGHEAFGKMRERGATIADIAVLVVSAEDGVKTQTLEAYNAIKSAGIPYVVAINKIDKENADIERTKLSLAENEIYLEGYGGDISFVPVSARTGQGIPDLLEILALTADIAGLKGDKNALAQGFVIETNRDAKKGISATLVIKEGILPSGAYVVCGGSMAPVRLLENFLGKKITEATMSSPVRLTSWDSVPAVGEMFVTYETKKEAEKAVEEFKPIVVAQAENVTESAEMKVIPVIIKSDAIGSSEAIKHELAKVKHERVHIKVVYSGIGDITESDIKMIAGTPGSVVLGFNVKIDNQAKAVIERLGIPAHLFSIIYKLTEWLDEYSKQNAPTIEVEEVLGQAKILKFFSKLKDKQIVGGKVLSGEIKLGHTVRVMRQGTQLTQGVIRELQQQKLKESTVREGYEFGAMIDAKIELAPGDIIEDFIMVEKK